MRKLLLMALVLAGVYLYFRLRRAFFLFELVVRDGRIVKSHGRIPPRLLADVADVVERAGLTKAKIRCVVRAGRPALVFEGEIGDGAGQSLRNVVGQFSTRDIRGGRGGTQ
jgi:hypothetical protein